MSGRPLGYDPLTGIAKYWHETSDGDWAQEMVQDCTDILDHNKRIANHGTPWDGPEREWLLEARIPHIIIEHWRHKYGFDYYSQDPEVQNYVSNRLLNSNEWRYLRVDGNKNHNVSMSGVRIGPEMPIFEAPPPPKIII